MSSLDFVSLRQAADEFVRRQLREFAAHASPASADGSVSSVTSDDDARAKEAATLARARCNQQTIDHLVAAAPDENAADARQRLVQLENQLRQTYPGPFGEEGSGLATDIRPSLFRTGLAVVLGSLTGWLLFSPEWSIGRDSSEEARVLANLLRPVMSTLGATLGLAWLSVPLPFARLFKLVDVVIRRLGVLWGAVVAWERRAILTSSLIVALFAVVIVMLFVLLPKTPNLALGIPIFFALLAMRLVPRRAPEHALARLERRLSDRLTRDVDVLVGYAAAYLNLRSASDEAPRTHPLDKKKLEELTMLVSRADPADAQRLVRHIRGTLGLAELKEDEYPDEFTWSVALAEKFEPFGIVKEGQTVEVLEIPVIVRQTDGRETVVRKGRVARPSGPGH